MSCKLRYCVQLLRGCALVGLLTTPCWLECGCGRCCLSSLVDGRRWTEKIEGAVVPALWNAMPALDCLLLNLFSMREKYTSILFQSLLF